MLFIVSRKQMSETFGSINDSIVERKKKSILDFFFVIEK